MIVLSWVLMLLQSAALAWYIARYRRQQRRLSDLAEQLAVARGETAALRVDIVNASGFKLLTLYAAESEMSGHIFSTDVGVVSETTAPRIRITRLLARRQPRGAA